MTRPWIFSLVLVTAACGYRGSPSQPPDQGIKKLVVSPASPTVSVGKSVQLMATAYDANDEPVTGITVTWKSDAPTIAIVDSNGVVTGVAVGDATISATATASSATTVNVVPP